MHLVRTVVVTLLLGGLSLAPVAAADLASASTLPTVLPDPAAGTGAADPADPPVDRAVASAPGAAGPQVDGVRVGAGSYAPTPPAEIASVADVRKTVDQHLYVDPSQAGKPVPTNQWWTDLLVSRYSGDMWAYPFVSSNSAQGTKVTLPTSWNADGTAMRLDAPVTVGGTVDPTPDTSDRVLADFEDGLPDGWTTTGDAFAGTSSGTASGQSAVSGWLGGGFVDSFTDRDGDGATGTLTSPGFTVDRSTLAFLVGGGRHPGAEAVQLLVDGAVVEEATGADSEELRWTTWDVSAYRGRTAQVRVVDSLRAGWAHVLVDQVLLTDAPDGIAERFTTAFSADRADALRWGDWNVSWRMPQAGPGGQYMDVTSVQGSPYEWFEFHGMTPRITLQDGAALTDADGRGLTGTITTDRFEIRQDGHVFGVHAPTGTTFTRSGNVLEASAGTPFLVLSAVPEQGLTLDDLHRTAFAVPRDTRMDYSYDPAAGQVEQRWSLQTDVLQGSDHDTVQGWLQHQYAEATHDLSFTGATYATPRGTMRTTVGHDGWTLRYAFSGLTPIGAEPTSTGDDPYREEVMRQYLSDYAAKETYGGDTYWGGKDLQQLGAYMSVADQIGDTEDADRMRATLERALTDWYTYSEGEREHFFAMYPTWKALIGFGDSYGSAQFNDNHFHYGYFTLATALLGRADPEWAQRYGEMATLVAKQYANWDRDDERFPHFRTFGVWTGHSNAGGVSSPGGNNQESSSEAIQSEAGLFLLGSVLGDEDMQAAGAVQYVTERAAVRDYYQNAHGNPASAAYDGDGAFPEAYDAGQAGILFDSGQAEATYFSGDPAWIYGIQWMPTAPWFTYFGWDPDFSKAIMRQMMAARGEVVGQDGVVDGNAGHVQMLTKKWWGVGTYGDVAITRDRPAAIGELQDAIRAVERNHPGYVTAKTATNPLYDRSTDTLYVSVDDDGSVVFPSRWWTPEALPAALVPAQLDGPTADRQPGDWPEPSPLLPFLVTDYRADPDTIGRLYGVDLTHHRPGADTARAAAVFSEMGDALGNVVLGFLAQYDPDTYADVHAALWEAQDPTVTGQSMAGMVYHQAMSNRTVGHEVTDRHTSNPLSQVFRAADGTYSYVIDNVDDVQRTYDVYAGQRVVGQIAVPARTQITSHLDARLAKVVVGTEGDPRTLAPGSTTAFTATGYDQYGATVPLDDVRWSTSAGTIDQDGTLHAGAAADQVSVTATVGTVSDAYDVRVAPAPVLTGIAVTPGTARAVVGEPVTFSAEGRDQYGDPAPLPADVAWSTTAPGTVTGDGTLTTTAPGAGYVVATVGDVEAGGVEAGGVEGSAVVSSIASVPVVEGTTATASSTDGGNTAAKAVDGDPATRWESAHGVDTVDLTLDLGSARDVDSVRVTWENAAAARYVVQVSDTDDGPWRNVRTVTNADASVDTVPVGATARFVRLHMTDRLTQYGYSVWDVQVTGTPATADVDVRDLLVAPRSVTVLPGSSVRLAAYGFDADGYGGLLTGDAQPVWTADEGATVSASGTATLPDRGGATATVRAVRGAATGQAVLTTLDQGESPAVSRDVAVGKRVTTSSDERGDLSGDAAVDDDDTTRWSSTARDGEWLAVDLGSVLPLDRVEVLWETAAAASDHVEVRDRASDPWRTVSTTAEGRGGTETHDLDGVRARFVRLVADSRTTRYGVSVWSFRVFSTEGTPTPDLARRAAVSSSGDESAGTPARHAVDGDPGTRWASEHRDDARLDVDLGARHEVHEATIRWEDAYGRAYRIEGRDGTTGAWTTIVTVTDGDGGTDRVPLSGTWRQIRLQGVDRATPYGYSVYGFEVR